MSDSDGELRVALDANNMFRLSNVPQGTMQTSPDTMFAEEWVCLEYRVNVPMDGLMELYVNNATSVTLSTNTVAVRSERALTGKKMLRPW